MTAKEKFAEFKKNLTQTAKDNAPALITFGVSALAIAAYTTYAIRSNAKSIVSDENDAFIVDSTGDIGLILTAGTIGRMLEEPSKFCFKFDEDRHMSLAPNDCTEVH